MIGHDSWSYRPYSPLLFETGDIYICRLAPFEDGAKFEWLPVGGEKSIFCREKGKGEFVLAGKTDADEFEIKGLKEGADYEFYVEANGKKSRVRLFRTGKPLGTVVNYLHPEDNAYVFSGKYLCSPSFVRMPSGALVASMDLYEHDYPQNLTLIYISYDNGKTWKYQCDMMPCFWGKLFVHKGVLYMLATSTEYGDLLIGASYDEGRTWTAPKSILRGSNGKAGEVGVHKNPENIVRYNGRLYFTIEWGSWPNKEYCHAPMIFSVSEDADLLDPTVWHFTPPVKYNKNWPGTAPDGDKGNIEGTLVFGKDGKLYSLMRYTTSEKKIIAYRVNTSDPDAPLEFDRVINFPANLSKFIIEYDEKSDTYYSIASLRLDEPKTQRNLLALLSSRDLDHWEVVTPLIDKRYEDPQKVGFQYVDFFIEGDDILYLCRTAYNGAHSFHDSNYSTFHIIKNFRDLIKK